MSVKRIYKLFAEREYRPTQIFYFPLYLWYGLQAIKFRSRGWIMATNPGLKNSGLIYEDKRTALNQISDNWKPKTILWEKNKDIDLINNKIIEIGIGYPCIAKANISWRSQKVKIINNYKELQLVNQLGRGDIILQEFIQDQKEFGVSYARIPGEEKGKVIGLMHRGFAKILGNGISTMEELVIHYPRYLKYKEIIQEQNKEMRNQVIPNLKEIIIMPFGAHSRGTIFEDWSDKIHPNLDEAIDKVAKQVDGFYVGRFDIKSVSLEAMEKGNFKVLELNGVGGIPAHMYDPKYSIFQGWNILFRYWNKVVQVALASLEIHTISLPNAIEMYHVIK